MHGGASMVWKYTTGYGDEVDFFWFRYGIIDKHVAARFRLRPKMACLQSISTLW